MSKNILVLTGSPRKGGNSELLADAFIKGAQAAGHTVTKFETAFKRINGCRACNTCWSKGRACSFEDDFIELAPLLQAADVLVLATPLYWSTFPAQLKAAIDKFYAYYSPICKSPLKIRQSTLLVCGETKDLEDFHGIIETYKSIIAFTGWNNLDIIAVPGVNDKGEVSRTGALAQAEHLGAGIV